MWLTKSQTNRSLYTQGVSGQNPGAQFEFNSSTGKIGYYEYALESNWNSYADSTDAIPLGEWLHFAMVRNSLIFTMYINGVAQTAPNTSNNSIGTPPAGPQWGFHRSSSSRYLDDVFLDQMRISNSARYTSAFTPSTTPFTADANTKLLIQSDYSEGGLGADHSNNYNYWTPNNLTVNDMMLDSPTNNFATLSPIHHSTTDFATLSEGNLKCVSDTSNFGRFQPGTIFVSSGKWYAEFYVVSGSQGSTGICPSTAVMDNSSYLGHTTGDGTCYYDGGSIFNYNNTGGQDTSVPVLSAGDILAVLLDLDDSGGLLYFYLNNTLVDTTLAGDKANAFDLKPASDFWTISLGNDGTWTKVANYGSDSSFAGNVTSQGYQDGNSKGDFYYAPPAGYLALCTDNLADPSIALPTEHYNTVAYSGDGTTPRTLNAGFQPDFTWLKIRTVAWSHRLFDSIRGANLALYSNSNAVQAAGTSGYLSGFASTGPTFTGNGADVRDVNETGDTYVTWNWKAGGAPTVDNSAGAGNTPTAGSVKINGSNLGSALAGSIATTRLSANTTAGFSISTYTGNSTAGATIAHGLSQAPEITFFKELTYVDNWVSYVEPLGNTKALFLDTENDAGTHTTYWNDTSPNATVITLGTDGKANSSRPHIMYAFHSVEGYSTVGSYSGNSNTDGPFLFTGFKPAWVLIKCYAGHSGQEWVMFDNKRSPYNLVDDYLYANTNEAEASGNDRDLDFVSNGIKFRGDGGCINVTGRDYIYLAFAESPFKTSNAR